MRPAAFIIRGRASSVMSLASPHLEEPSPLTHYQNPNLSHSSADRIVILCSWNLGSPIYRHQSPRGFPYKVPKTAVVDQMAPVCPKWWEVRDHWSPVHLRVRDHQPSSQSLLWSRRLLARLPAHKALNCQVNIFLGRPPSSQWHCNPARPRNRWVDQIRCDNNLPPADHECYEKFLDVVGQRQSWFCNFDTTTAWFIRHDLEENHAVWHRTCYSEVTHKQHTERDRNIYKRALIMKDSSVLLSQKRPGRPTASLSSAPSEGSLNDGSLNSEDTDTI